MATLLPVALFSLSVREEISAICIFYLIFLLFKNENRYNVEIKTGKTFVNEKAKKI